MSKILELLAKYIGVPLLEKVGAYILKEFKTWQNKRKIKKEENKKTNELKQTDKPKDIRRINRNRTL